MAEKKYDFSDEQTKNFPRMVIAGLSFVCNAKCIHCIYNSFAETKLSTGSGKAFMDEAVFKKIADECAKYPHNLLRIVGFGEPMLHPKFIELMTYAKSAGCNVGVITNGSLMTADISEKLLDINIDAIDISVDAFSKEVYEQIRVGLDFNRLVENVKKLVELRNKKQKKTFIFGSIVEQKEVMGELDKALVFWGKIVDKVVSRKFLTFGLFTNPELRVPYYEKRVPCFLLYDRINVDVNGCIRQCGYDSFGKTNFGNVLETTIREAWNSPELNRIRACHQNGNFAESGLCQDCQDWPFHSWDKNYIQDSYIKIKNV